MAATVKAVTHQVMPVTKDYGGQLQSLVRLLQSRGTGKTLLFANTKRDCSRITSDLKRARFKAAELHGDIAQGQR